MKKNTKRTVEIYGGLLGLAAAAVGGYYLFTQSHGEPLMALPSSGTPATTSTTGSGSLFSVSQGNVLNGSATVGGSGFSASKSNILNGTSWTSWVQNQLYGSGTLAAPSTVVATSTGNPNSALGFGVRL